MASTHPDTHPGEHDIASLGAVVVAGLLLAGLLVGAAVVVAQVVDVVVWSFRAT